MIETIHDVQRFSQLREEWAELLAASASDSPFLTWEWLFAWWKHLGGPRRLSIVTVRSGGDLVAIAPLALRPPQFGIPRPFYCLEFLGAGSVGTDALDVIVRSGEENRALPILTDYVAQGRIMLELAPARGRASLVGRLADRVRTRGWDVTRTRTAVCPYIALKGRTWDSYFATLGPRHRATYLRRLHGLSKRSDLRFEVATTESERRRFLGHLIDLRNRRWMALGGSEAFYLPGLAAFHDEFGALALQCGWLRLFLLFLGDSPLAAIYGLRYKRRFYLYQSAFDSDSDKDGAAIVATGLAIKSAIEEGVQGVDLLHDDAGHRWDWTRHARDLVRIEVYPPGVKSALRGRVPIPGRTMPGRAQRPRVPSRSADDEVLRVAGSLASSARASR